MYGASSAPTGWVNCDGASLLRAGTYADLFAVISTTYGTADGTHFNVPDMRGAFPRGQGTSTQFTQDHATTLGTYEDDAMQGHYHKWFVGNTTASFSHLNSHNQIATANNAGGRAFKSTAGGSQDIINAPKSDTVNGTPRTGNETRPNNLGVNFIIKF